MIPLTPEEARKMLAEVDATNHCGDEALDRNADWSGVATERGKALDQLKARYDETETELNVALRARDEARAKLATVEADRDACHDANSFLTKRLDDALKAVDPQGLAAGAIQAQRRAEVERDTAIRERDEARAACRRAEDEISLHADLAAAHEAIRAADAMRDSVYAARWDHPTVDAAKRYSDLRAKATL